MNTYIYKSVYILYICIYNTQFMNILLLFIKLLLLISSDIKLFR